VVWAAGYYAQLTCIVQLLLFPHSCSLFKANFLLSNGK
jgi:hypothetical protein